MAVEIQKSTQQLCTDLKTDIKVDLRTGDTPQSKRIKQNTINKFGPVRQVKPQLVFEIAFEGVSLSSRHKSGVSVRFPRILRQRHDKKIAEANSVKDLKKLIV